MHLNATVNLILPIWILGRVGRESYFALAS